MSAPRNRQHLTIQTTPVPEDFTPHGQGGDSKTPPEPPNRPRHSKQLIEALRRVQTESRARREDAGFSVRGAKNGLYIAFDSRQDLPLEVASLEVGRRGVELVSVRTIKDGEHEVEEAVVFVPDGKLKRFLDRFEKYGLTTEPAKGEIRHHKLGDSIATLRLATIKELWTDEPEAYPSPGEVIWWEVWLRNDNGDELARFYEFVEHQQIRISDQRLGFDDRTVVLIEAAPEQLAASLDVISDVAELRRAKESPRFFDRLNANEQAEWVNDLLGRVTTAPDTAAAITVLDSGVASAHPLLEGSLHPDDCHSYQPTWGTDDHHGHGTEMAGLALFGNLNDALQGTLPIQFHHRLESVKILPPTGTNEPQLYGAITAESASRVEVTAPDRSRCFSLAVTAPDQRDRGRPTSWSAAIDALAMGRSFDTPSKGLVYLDDDAVQRLFVLAAGNVSQPSVNWATENDVQDIHDPAQAWNALTVGACTHLTSITDPTLAGYEPVAAAGDPSPWSTTSVMFGSGWPIKPDVVFEGGNPADDGTGFLGSIPDLSLLTTHHKPTERLFSLSWATSAATAQVARIAASIASSYPDWWPETVRGMVVHSAEWTPKMLDGVHGAPNLRERQQVLRRFGYGMPSMERALRSADDALTLVAQASIKPFKEGKIRHLHLHELPWPKEQLEALEDTEVQLRITLSYFVEPNPARRGWRTRYRYQSHGLRFEVVRPTETPDAFHKRLNKLALDEEENRPKASADDGWLIGPRQRTAGSLHSDIWTGTARDLASRNVIAVYPVSGWWKDEKARDRSAQGARYSLVASLTTEAEDVDIWTPVAAQIGVPVEIAGEWQ